MEYSAMDREITDITDEENMLNQYINKIGFRNLLKVREIKPFPFQAGPSPIQCNSRPVMSRKGLGRLDKDLKTN
ncbi:hypothetical protein F2Q69_00035209 [Brassica cretica]|uniref:Uncharacterized protein n=1 Tax=Brassica cretica TaxID=69181 RepID=A0A8S9SF15_BRACR|nr:hypothetical protein F2Q69_00035209 [Brassica cretica]